MKNYIKIAAWVVSFQSVGALIGRLMYRDVEGWYQMLQRSALTPPDYLFGLVWPILYAMLALVGYHLWNFAEQTPQLQQMKKAYALQMLLNWSWSLIFFNFRMTSVSLAVIGSMIVLTLFILLRLLSKAKLVSILLMPYLCWISFAWYLNWYIVVNN